MSTDNKNVEVPVTRVDRWLALASLTLIAAAVVCFFIVIIASTQTQNFDAPFLRITSGIMYFGLPLGVVLFFALLISNMVRRSRLAKADRNR